VIPATAHELGVRIDVITPDGVIELSSRPFGEGSPDGSAPAEAIIEVVYVASDQEIGFEHGFEPDAEPNHYLATRPLVGADPPPGAGSGAQTSSTLGSAQSQPVGPAAATGTIPGPPPAGSLTGQTLDGDTVTFAPEQLQRRPMVGYAGRTIGVMFPSRPHDGSVWVPWAAMPIMAMDLTYVPDRDRLIHKPEDRGEVDAPWSDQTRAGSPPIYITAHADPWAMSVVVDLAPAGAQSAYRVVFVDGDTFGAILVADSHLRALSAAGPTRPVVLLCCAAGSPLGDAAARVALRVRGAGHEGSLYAATNDAWVKLKHDAAYGGVQPGRGPSPVAGIFREFTGEEIPGAAPEGGTPPNEGEGPVATDASVDTDSSVGSSSAEDSEMALGRGPDGSRVLFEPGRVTASALNGPDGQVAGLFYPGERPAEGLSEIEMLTAPAGRSEVEEWAASDRRLDNEYATTVDRRPWETVTLGAPWAGRNPLYVCVDSGANHFKVDADIDVIGSASEVVTLKVNGAEFAKVVGSNPIFEAVLQERPDRPVVLLASDVANPIGHAARVFANVLHEWGYRTDVFAHTGHGWLTSDPDAGTSGYELGPDGFLDEPGRFERFSPPDTGESTPEQDEADGDGSGDDGSGDDGDDAGQTQVAGPAGVEPAADRATTLAGTVLATGAPIEFSADRVQVIALRDSHDRVSGVSFPTQEDDAVRLPRWAGRPHRSSDVIYRSEGASGLPARRRMAPWAGRTPFYVHAHSGPEHFEVTVLDRPVAASSGIGPVGSSVVRVDGAVHGRLVAGNEHFRRAAAAEGTRPLVYLSCRAAHPSGTAGALSAAQVHAGGHRGSVFAPNGTGRRARRGSGKKAYTWYTVKSDEHAGVSIEGEFVQFPAPRLPDAVMSDAVSPDAERAGIEVPRHGSPGSSVTDVLRGRSRSGFSSEPMSSDPMSSSPTGSDPAGSATDSQPEVPPGTDTFQEE
jgi:hypothetical protein